MRLLHHPEIECDLHEAACFYRKDSSEVAERFLQAFDAGIESIKREPYRFRRIEGSIRRCLLHRYPYSIFYPIYDDVIFVGSLCHQARDAKHWRERFD